MKIAVFAYVFPALTESFCRREVAALRDLGHDVRVFVGRAPVDSYPVAPVRGVKVEKWNEVGYFRPDVIYAEMGYPAHEAAVMMAKEFHTPYTLRLWSGLDSFGLPSHCFPFYRDLKNDVICQGVVVEDYFMVQFARSRLGITEELLTVVPNSLNISAFSGPRNPDPNTVLAVARFVPKKGLIHLVKAIKKVPEARLTLVGAGPEKKALVAAANKQVTFRDVVPEDFLPELYRKAATFVAPGIQTGSGDADGIPTTVLEAMASGCPVITSDLLSSPCYVKHGVNGILVKPGDEIGLQCAVASLLHYPAAAEGMGRAGREWASENLDIDRNIRKIEAVLRKGTHDSGMSANG